MTLRDAMRFDADRAALYLERGWWSQADTLSRWLVRAASGAPHAPAIVGDGQSLSYGALAERVAALAGGLRALGLGAGDVVAVQLPNRAEYLVSYLAICAMGGVMTTLYMPYRAAEMESLLAHSGARAFIGLDEIAGFKAAQTVLELPAPDRHAPARPGSRRCARRSPLVCRPERSGGARPVGRTGRRRPVSAALYVGHLISAQGRSARLPGHPRKRPSECRGTRNHRRGPDSLRRPVRAPLRPLQLSSRSGGRCVHRAAARVRAAGPRPGSPRGIGHRPVRRASACGRLPGRRAAERRGAVVASTRGHGRQRRAARRREGTPGAHRKRSCHAALGHDRAPGPASIPGPETRSRS